MTGLTFEGSVREFLDGADSPVDFLERCIAQIEERETDVRAWVTTRFEGARRDAAASRQRYLAGRPLSAIDGLPIGIKDLIATRSLPTGFGIAGHSIPSPDDSAVVQALRAAGAVIVGKTVTTELGGAVPSVTTNPLDCRRTPGGSSSGSAAAVAANMVPVAIGTQVGGSILRPASYCGNVAIKPTMGALHRGERLGLSHACTGVHANGLADLWTTLVEIGRRSGGDPGYPGLFGSLPLPALRKPKRFAVMHGPAWNASDPNAKAAFDDFLARTASAGVEIALPGSDKRLDSFHDMLGEAARLVILFINWENRSMLANLMASIPHKLNPITIKAYEAGLRISIDDYRMALDQRDLFRRKHAELSDGFDGIISLSATGAAPLIDDPNRPPGAAPTGNAAYNIVPSLLGAPALTLPLLSVDGMPLGVQLMGQWHDDERLVATGRWMMDALNGRHRATGS